ncbi:hypothetical protein FDF74_04675 [Clostridium niameyense]|uniref:Endonuclease n=1 Tax=Clostridium niameyense TaxID=1622073 RepID=A0A6M0RA81_9CLOT|nr:NUMOD4 domain-containing protein [Clostridium niameyense]NEZ46509.1 hypothetical protein [Clostridium niameyense]
MKETWKDIIGYKGLYKVSNFGRVKSLKRYKNNHSKLQVVDEKIKSTRKDIQGYLLLDLYKDNIGKTFRVHRLVADAFIENSENKESVNHIDGNKENNRVSNLEWATFKEQNEHFYRNNLKSKDSINKAIKAMNKAQSKRVKCLNNGIIYESASEAARVIGVSGSLIMRCCRGERKSAGKDENMNPLHWIYL